MQTVLDLSAADCSGRLFEIRAWGECSRYVHSYMFLSLYSIQELGRVLLFGSGLKSGKSDDDKFSSFLVNKSSSGCHEEIFLVRVAL